MSQEEESGVQIKPLRISSRQVLLLNALDKCRNMRRAALAMHTTQPTASLLLQQLEERLKVKLFERLPRGMAPTIYGEVLIRYANGVSHDFEHAEAEIAQLLQGASGFMRIGSVYGTVPSLLRDTLIAFKKDNPGVRISIEVGMSDILIPSLIRGDLDLVLGRMPDQLTNHDLVIDFFDQPEHICVIARPGHKLADRKNIALSELVDLTWILSPIGSPMRSRVETALRISKMTSNLDIIETSSILAITALLETSDMISVLPNAVALHYERYGMVKILPVDLSISMVNLGIITKSLDSLSPAVMAFRNYLKNTA